jgi:hypothetical protein
MNMIEALTVGNIICALVCAKWALDLNFTQVRQILWLLTGILLGPVTLLVLYVYLVKKASEKGQPGAKWI